jgi:Na+-transporting NADH:ubiquinone oxidoreductase subunit C
MKDNARVILFATILGIVCSILLVGATLFTAPYRMANEKAEEVRNFLSALEVPIDIKSNTEALLAVFNRDVKERELGELMLYEYRPQTGKSVSAGAGAGTPSAIAVPFDGMGLWGPVRGVLALEADLLTIRAVRFYQQEETPGLGGEIGAEWFQKQFKGKKIVSSSGEAGFQILKPGSEKDENSVDGISGATMTSDRVKSMLDNLSKQIYKERKNYVQ